MVRRFVTEPRERSSWRIKPPHDAQTQGLIVSAFPDLCWSEALFLRIDAPGGAWLNLLQGPTAITNAQGQTAQAAAIGFTWTGLQKLGLGDKNTCASFAVPFQEGMHQEDRLRRLGDKLDGAWRDSVIEGGPLWSGDEPPQAAGQTRPIAAGGGAKGQPRSAPCTVHSILLLYDADRNAVAERASKLSKALAARNVITVRQLSLDLRLDDGKVAREHFGFADGLSQPIPYGDAIIRKDGRPAEKDPLHGVPAGEFLIGHLNAHHEKAPGPVVPADDRARDAELTAEGAPEGFLNFGHNGSYMVVRELKQDVASFWNSFEKGAQGITAGNAGASHITASWLAERAVGRSLDGDLLRPNGYLGPKDGRPDNDFGFFDSDRQGCGCPLGSHVRRTNPRDGLARDEAAASSALDAVNNHRILRRGRKFGSTIADRNKDDGEDRGLLFICLNTDIVRQFEFVQQTWLLNKNFGTLFDETDPLVGPKGPFTIPENPLRRIVEVDTFIQMAGGEYFFLPSIPALKYLAAS